MVDKTKREWVEVLRLAKGATELKVTGGGRSAAADAVSPAAA
jgi:hypothetical protein